MFERRIMVVMATFVLLTSGGAWAQSSATANGSANAKVIKPISLIQSSAMNFSVVISTAKAENLILSPSGIAAFDGVNLTRQNAEFTPGRFIVSGESNYTYAISVPIGGVQLTLYDDPSKVLALDDFLSYTDASGSVNVTSGTLDANGVSTFKVGAMLSVPGGARAGEYYGSYSIIIFYN